MANTITYEQWRASLDREVDAGSSEAKTANEWADALGVSKAAALKWLGNGTRNEWMGVTRARRERIDGCSSSVPAYYLLTKDPTP